MVGMHWFLALVALHSGLSNARPRPASAPAGYVVHEARSLSPRNRWVKRDRIEASAVLPVRIGLAQTNLDRGHDLLMELSHPDSPKYGQWWSAQEVHDFFAPAPEAVDLVRTWIKSTGIAAERIVHSDNKGWLAVDATVEEAELLFATTFHEYEHPDEDGIRVGTDSYHLPEHLVPHIDYVTPGAKLVRVKKRKLDSLGALGPGSLSSILRPLIQKEFQSLVESFAGDLEQLVTPAAAPGLDPSLRHCGANMTISCVRYMYGIPENPQAVQGHSLGVYSTGIYFAKPDLDAQYSLFAQWVPNGTYPIPALIDGAQYDTSLDQAQDYGGETVFDMQIAQPIIYPQNITLYMQDDPLYAHDSVYVQNDRTVALNTFLDALDGSYCTYSAYGQTGDDPAFDAIYPNPDPAGYQGQLMCGVYKPTNVITISFGTSEQSISANYQKRECDEFLKLGLQGVSIFVASGDEGVAGAPGDPVFSGCLGPDETIFNVQHIVTCPYVTSVGATMLLPNETAQDEEQVMKLFVPFPERNTTFNYTSSGGFSNLFPIPDYQKEAVQYYFDNYDPGYPYYAELNPDFNTVKGRYNRIGRGTPDVSAMGMGWEMVIGGEVIQNLGTSLSSPLFAGVVTLINQERALIGKGPIGFMNPALYAHPEILNDIVKGSSWGCGTPGFNATPRWDPTTGLGTPNYEKMRDLWLTLP